jgi:hypothetical protein
MEPFDELRINLPMKLHQGFSASKQKIKLEDFFTLLRKIIKNKFKRSSYSLAN